MPVRDFALLVLAAALAAGCGSTTEPVPEGNLIITPAVDTIAAGAELQLAARIAGAIDTVALTDVLWSSSNPDVASVSADGRVTGIRSGNAMVIALVADQRATTTIRVERRFTAASVAVGPNAVCALDAGGHAWCFGDNEFGQLGNGVAGSVGMFPTPVTGGHIFESVGLGRTLGCGLATDGQALCWGSGGNHLGLGASPVDPSSVPAPADPTHSYEALGTGSDTCGLTGGVTWCWGGMYNSQIRRLPFGGAMLTFSSLSIGPGFDCGLSSSNAAICWQPGFTDSYAEFFGGSVRRISVGSGFLCAVHLDGTAACQGRNDAGQLGAGGVSDSIGSPLSLAVARQWAEISAGNRSASALTSDGAAWCWGANESGQLGRGDSTSSAVPVAAATPVRFKAIAVGGASGDVNTELVCAISMADELYCWGTGWPPRPAPVVY